FALQRDRGVARKVERVAFGAEAVFVCVVSDGGFAFRCLGAVRFCTVGAAGGSARLRNRLSRHSDPPGWRGVLSELLRSGRVSRCPIATVWCTIVLFGF